MHVFLSVLLGVVVFADGGEKTPANGIESVLSEKDPICHRAAFDAIARDSGAYVEAIRIQLARYKSDPIDNERLDTLLYLAAFTKDTTLAPPIIDIVNRFASPDDRETKLGCIYACPVEFALVVFASFTSWKLPAEFRYSDDALASSVVHGVDFVGKTTLDAGHARDQISGVEKIEAHLERLANTSYEKLLEFAGPENSDATLRTLAASELQYRTVDSTHLNDLYWLAIQGKFFERESRSATTEFYGAICQAIYRAEKAKRSER